MRDSINYVGLAWHVRWLQFMRNLVEGRKAAEVRPEPAAPVEAEPEIAIGSRWRFKTDDPFPPKFLVEVVDVKDGWVRYRMSTRLGILQDDERRDIDSFLYCYKPFEH